MQWLTLVRPGWIALVTLVVLVLAAEGAARLGQRTPSDEARRSHANALQATVLGLLGLFFAFTFSMAVSRYEARRLLVTEEANAIGTAWLRAGALAPPADEEARALFRAYVDARLAYFDAGEDRAAIAAAVRRAGELEGELWALATAAAAEDPRSLPRALLLEALNTVIDLQEERVSAHDARVPPTVVVLLVGLAAAGLGTVGYALGLSRLPHRSSCLLLAALLTAILYVVLDLDQPRTGSIRVSQGAMIRLQETLATPP